MSSIDKSLSSYKTESVPDAKGFKIGIVISEWNEDITIPMGESCKETLLSHGVLVDDIVISFVPGAFELPLGARMMLSNQKLDAVICIGCVIKGETKHDEYISGSVASGIMQLGLTIGKPIIFGVLTPNDKQQALDRAGGKHGNKGVEAAVTALKMIRLTNQNKEDKKGIGFSS